MLAEVALGAERLVAVRARVRSQARVREQVSLERRELLRSTTALNAYVAIELSIEHVAVTLTLLLLLLLLLLNFSAPFDDYFVHGKQGEVFFQRIISTLACCRCRFLFGEFLFLLLLDVAAAVVATSTGADAFTGQSCRNELAWDKWHHAGHTDWRSVDTRARRVEIELAFRLRLCQRCSSSSICNICCWNSVSVARLVCGGWRQHALQKGDVGVYASAEASVLFVELVERRARVLPFRRRRWRWWRRWGVYLQETDHVLFELEKWASRLLGD